MLLLVVGLTGCGWLLHVPFRGARYREEPDGVTLLYYAQDPTGWDYEPMMATRARVESRNPSGHSPRDRRAAPALHGPAGNGWGPGHGGSRPAPSARRNEGDVRDLG